VIGGIEGCIVTLIYGGPVAAGVVCGVTLTAAGNAAEDPRNIALSGSVYAEDMWSCLPVASRRYPNPVPATGGSPPPAENPNKEKWKKVCLQTGGSPYVERIQREDACLGDPVAICNRYSTLNDASKKLIGAYCEPGGQDSQDQVTCVWCTPGIG